MSVYAGVVVVVAFLAIAVLYVLHQMRSEIRQFSHRLETKHESSTRNDSDPSFIREFRTVISEIKSDDALRRTNLDVATALSVQDRLQLARLVALMNALDAKITDAATHAEGVAEDLAASHERANETTGPSGAAADAAFKTS